MGQDNIMCKCLTTSEALIILKELHEGVEGGHFVVDITVEKFLDARYWWLVIFKDIHEFCRSYDSRQRTKGLKTKNLAKLVITIF